MGITDVVKKMIWALSRNSCYICKNQVAKYKDGKPLIVGEMAHIVSAKPGGPRHLKMNEYDVVENLMVLCMECHKHIDTHVEKFPTEKLKNIKREHENAIERSNSKIQDNPNHWIGKVIVDPATLVNLMMNAEAAMYDIDSRIGFNKVAYEFKDLLYDFHEEIDVYENVPSHIYEVLDEKIKDLYKNNLVLLGAIAKQKFGNLNVIMNTMNIHITSIDNFANLEKISLDDF